MQHADLVVEGGTLITMDAANRVIEDGAIAIVGDRIAAVGSRAEVAAQIAGARKTVDARRHAVLPGLIDTHGHGGHTLARTIGAHTRPYGWRAMIDHIYFRSATEAYWYADGCLSALEPTNNNQDLFAVMKMTGLLQRVVRRDPALLPPGRVLEMATRDGARAAYLDAGAIEPGRLADLAIVDLSAAHNQPLHRPVSALVHSALASDVESVVVGGRVVMHERRLLTVDEDRIIAEATRRAHDLLRRSGVDADRRPEWPWA